MAELQKIRKRLLLENDVFPKFKETDLFEATYSCIAELAEMIMADGGMQALEHFSDRWLPSGRSLRLNTYPIGEPTKEIYPEFLGVYSSRTQKSMTALFNAVKKQLDHYRSRQFCNLNKSITIVTDTWDPKIFQKYEALFVEAALNDDVCFNFYLVTDYGITRIPFLNQRQTDDLRREYAGQHVDEEEPLDELIEKTGLRKMKYKINQYKSFADSRQFQSNVYDFDFCTLQCSFHNDNTEKNIERKTDKTHVMRFVKAVIALEQAGGIDNDVYASAGTERIVDFEGHIPYIFHWYDETVAEQIPEFKKMRDALEAMVKALK